MNPSSSTPVSESGSKRKWLLTIALVVLGGVALFGLSSCYCYGPGYGYGGHYHHYHGGGGYCY